MTPLKRIQDMLPALVVFAVVAVFATYATVAFVVRDPQWLQTLVDMRDDAPQPDPSALPTSHGAPR